MAALKKPPLAGDLSFDPCIAVVIATGGAMIPPEAVEEHILGFALGLSFADETMESAGFGVVRYSGRRRDIGTAIGPAITTPDEIEETVVEQGTSKRYQMSVVARVNGREVGVWNLADLPVSIAEVVSVASESCKLDVGDLICIGLPARDKNRAMSGLDRGDEIQLVCDRLGSLTTVIA